MSRSELMSSASSLRPYVTEPRHLTGLPGEDFWRGLLFGVDDAEPRSFEGLSARINLPDDAVIVDWTPR